VKRFVLVLVILFSSGVLNAQEHMIPYSQSDRDRLVRVETLVQTSQEQVNRLEDKFDGYFMWGFGLVLMSIFGLIGFIIYDRRTTLAPA